MRHMNIRIYYEDTDHGGVVYHANYLKFMERARTEHLRELGFEQSTLAKEEDVVFALSRSDIRYLRPAFFDELLDVQTSLVEAKGARMLFKQNIYRGNELLVEGDIWIACMSKSGKAKRIPPYIRDRINEEKS